MAQKKTQRIALILLTVFINSTYVFEGFSFTEKFKQGNFRGEITTTNFCGRQLGERRNDYMFIGTLEYEWPIAEKSTMSIRSYPIMIYYLDENKRGDSDYIYAGGIGIAGKQYQNLYMTKGWFGEVGFVPILQSEDFKNNGSRINFVFNAGFGYEFANGMTLSGKYYHISNANLDEENQGLDIFAVSIGWRF